MGKWGKWGTRASAFRSRTHRWHREREGTHKQPSQERKASHQHVQMTGEADGRNRTREQGTVSGVARLEGLCFSRSRELFSSRSRKVFSVPIIQYWPPWPPLGRDSQKFWQLGGVGGVNQRTLSFTLIGRAQRKAESAAERGVRGSPPGSPWAEGLQSVFVIWNCSRA